jgi:hypothetical protein
VASSLSKLLQQRLEHLSVNMSTVPYLCCCQLAGEQVPQTAAAAAAVVVAAAAVAAADDAGTQRHQWLQ